MLRFIIFCFYIIAITHWGEIERFFQYHGAEYKVIHGLERNETDNLDITSEQSSRHPRCGISFIMTVMVVSILLFSLFGWPVLWQRILLRILLLPIVAGLSYEAIKFFSASKSPVLSVLTATGMWLQKVTTKEPDRAQLEVALSALKAVVSNESKLNKLIAN